MWVLRQTSTYEIRCKKYNKKHPNEAQAAFNNLHTIHNALNGGIKPSQLKAGFIHTEPNGIIALDQTGAQGNPKQIRLYIYPDENNLITYLDKDNKPDDSKVIYLITIGDKHSQQKDIIDCKKFVEDLKKGEIQ